MMCEALRVMCWERERVGAIPPVEGERTDVGDSWRLVRWISHVEKHIFALGQSDHMVKLFSFEVETIKIKRKIISFQQ